MTTILGLGGSLRKGSITSTALTIALKGAEQNSVTTRMIDLGEWKLPTFDGTYELDGYAPKEQMKIEKLLEAVNQADGFILGSPTYNSNIGGSFKNALDLLEITHDQYPSRLRNKVVGMVTVQGGTSGTGHNTLTSILLTTRAMGAWVSPKMVCITGSETAFDEYGNSRNASIDLRLREVGKEVAEMSNLFTQYRAALAK